MPSSIRGEYDSTKGARIAGMVQRLIVPFFVRRRQITSGLWSFFGEYIARRI
jgi:hypothetical protein